MSGLPNKARPYFSLRPEQKLLRDLYNKFVHGKAPGSEYLKDRTRNSFRLNGGSENFGELAHAVWCLDNPTEPFITLDGKGRIVGVGDFATSYEQRVSDMRKHGHNGQEFNSGNYGYLNVYARAIMALTDNDALKALEADAFLWAMGATKITAGWGPSWNRVSYEGWGSRVAGLRTSPHAWDGGGPLDYLMVRLLGLGAKTSPRWQRINRPFMEMADKLVVPLQDELSWRSGTAFTRLTAGWSLSIFQRAYLTDVASRITTPGDMVYEVVKYKNGDVWSALYGDRVGNNTSVLWGVRSVAGGTQDDCEFAFPWTAANGKPMKRVRGGKLRKPTGKVCSHADNRGVRVVRGGSANPVEDVFFPYYGGGSDEYASFTAANFGGGFLLKVAS